MKSIRSTYIKKYKRTIIGHLISNISLVYINCSLSKLCLQKIPFIFLALNVLNNVRHWLRQYFIHFFKPKTALTKIEKFFYVFIIAALFKYKLGSVNSINDLSIE